MLTGKSRLPPQNPIRVFRARSLVGTGKIQPPGAFGGRESRAGFRKAGPQVIQKTGGRGPGELAVTDHPVSRAGQSSAPRTMQT